MHVYILYSFQFSMESASAWYCSEDGVEPAGKGLQVNVWSRLTAESHESKPDEVMVPLALLPSSHPTPAGDGPTR